MIKCMFFFWNSWTLKIKLARPAALPKIWCVFLVLGLCSSDVGRADVGFREDRWAKGRRGNSWCLVVWSIGFPPQTSSPMERQEHARKAEQTFQQSLGQHFFLISLGALDIEMSEIEDFFECLILVILNPWQAWKNSICCEVQGCSCASLHSGVATGKLFKLHVLSWCVVEAWVFFSNLQECDGVESEILAQEVGMYTAEIADSLL